MYVEPQKWAFNRLKNKFSEREDFKVLNKALSLEKGLQSFYEVEESVHEEVLELEDVGEHYTLLSAAMSASLKKEHLLKIISKVDGLTSDDIVESKIKTWTLKDFLNFLDFLGYKRLNTLIFDIEGLDYEVIASNKEIFSEYLFDTIIFEFSNMTFEQFSEILYFFSDLGYVFQRDKLNIICIRESLVK